MGFLFFPILLGEIGSGKILLRFQRPVSSSGIPTYPYGYRDVLVRGYVDEVVIGCGSEVIARHIRSYERDDFVYAAALGA